MKWTNVFERRPPVEQYVLGYLDGWCFITRLLNEEDWAEHDSWDTGDHYKRPSYKEKEKGKTKRLPSHWMILPTLIGMEDEE